MHSIGHRLKAKVITWMRKKLQRKEMTESCHWGSRGRFRMAAVSQTHVGGVQRRSHKVTTLHSEGKLDRSVSKNNSRKKDN